MKIKYSPIIQGWERSVNMANEWYEQAKKKLEAEKKAGKYDRYAQVMKDRVCETIDLFCRKDAEFAQAVVQGGTFEDCMKEVAVEAKSYGDGHGIPDLESFRRAVQFYFPGADVKFHMELNLSADVEAAAAEQLPKTINLINIDDFLV